MCQFQSLSFKDDGYVIRCRECKYYQVIFGSLLLTFSTHDFTRLCKMVKFKCSEENYESADIKSIIIPTPFDGISFFLSQNEIKQFNEILEEADNEVRALSLMDLFNK